MRKDRIILSVEEISSRRTKDKDKIHKIKNVLRKRPADYIYLLDGCGKEYRAKIQRSTASIMEFDIEDVEKAEKQTTSRIVLGFSLLKFAKIDFVLQKCTELGIDEFVPFISRYSVAKQPGMSKIQHWRRKIEEAVCQSGRLFIPKFNSILKFSRLVQGLERFGLVLVGSQDSDADIFQILTQVKNKRFGNVLLLVGPEGGFSKEEARQLKSCQNVNFVNLSNFTLRSETAAMFFSGVACYLLRRG